MKTTAYIRIKTRKLIIFSNGKGKDYAFALLVFYELLHQDDQIADGTFMSKFEHEKIEQ